MCSCDEVEERRGPRQTVGVLAPAVPPPHGHHAGASQPAAAAAAAATAAVGLAAESLRRPAEEMR
eukprot:COSAG01_NODE_13_length_41723_cov_145.394556_7_plen_65_part_00